MHADHHHRGGVELAVLQEQPTAVFAELRVGFVAEDQVLVDADCAGATCRVASHFGIPRALRKGLAWLVG